ncbi:uncharacterized protein MONOS_16623 [Monocercomonoides exilis]|uniref:uncharacterized protein n=1 Tax=Monocercomonoides exilis TaxID=2049356 RepID=UPI00355A3A4D|nr:hypothetical protein MONOS_16623 [Monocercomonoides exilis]|eukprot:MONOS_16623.1-p1 / transcript=MONOS_16623.1 / gene=MONOS_16623 / organism=Monocercomonoides_exilis_PA203 / gene_product=unspecified product / transcript_product=unspecified product / location=Mono_scaffold01936:1528-1956(-) / protein_length=143 / sequence_SO=supercontig / SO=protein_coding / is_pseudo=false
MEISWRRIDRWEKELGSAVDEKRGNRCKAGNDSIFSMCISEYVNGGALKREVAEGLVVVVENSTFEGCSVRGSEEKGGEIFISADGKSRADCFGVNECVLERNRAGEGKDVYAVCEDLKASILLKRFEIELVGKDGEDKVEL